MRRAFAVAAGITFVACGLSVEGIAPLSSDGGIVEAGIPDSPNEPGTDARVPDASVDGHVSGPDCHVAVQCDAGVPSDRCFAETCSAGASWADDNGNGGVLSEANGACKAVAQDMNGYGLRRAHATVPDHYAYSFTFALPAAGTGEVFPLAVVVFSSSDGIDLTRGQVVVAVMDGKLALCRSNNATDKLACTKSAVDAPANGQGYYRVSGEIDRRSTEGTRTALLELADSATSCNPILSIAMKEGHFDGEANALIGCLGGPCTTEWQSAFFTITPL